MKKGIVKLRNGNYAQILAKSRKGWKGKLLNQKYPLYWTDNGDEIGGYKEFDIVEFKRGNEGGWPDVPQV